MIISCPSCHATFRVDESALGPDGKKVRCSKCSHVWHAMPEAAPAGPAAEVAEEPAVEPAPEAAAAARQPAPEAEGQPEPEPAAGDGGEAPGQEEPKPGGAEGGKSGAAGLTEDQRAKLAAARQHKSRSRFWIKALVIFIIVLGLLALAQRMIPKLNHQKAGPAMEQPAPDPGKAEAIPPTEEPAEEDPASKGATAPE